MNKQFLLSILIVIITISYSIDSIANNSYKTTTAIAKVINSIKITVLPQVELISIIQTISKYPTVMGFLMAKDTSDYKTDVINHFSSFKNHPAVQMLDRLSLHSESRNRLITISLNYRFGQAKKVKIRKFEPSQEASRASNGNL